MSPVIRCSNGKYRIGSGGCNFDSKEKAEAAYRAYLAKKHDSKNEIGSIKEKIEAELKDVEQIRKEVINIKLELGE